MSVPDQFDIDLATLKRLLQDLPDDWRIIADHPKQWLLFDADMIGCAELDLELRELRMIDGGAGNGR